MYNPYYDGSAELYHYGIKGMKWGVRRTPEQLGHVSGVRSNKKANQSFKDKIYNKVSRAVRNKASQVKTQVQEDDSARIAFDKAKDIALDRIREKQFRNFVDTDSLFSEKYQTENAKLESLEKFIRDFSYEDLTSREGASKLKDAGRDFVSNQLEARRTSDFFNKDFETRTKNSEIYDVIEELIKK